MKKSTVILLLLFVALAIFSSCASGESKITTESEISENQPTEMPYINITQEGTTEYMLIRPSEASSAVTSAFVRLHNAINETYGVNMELGDDFILPGKEAHPYEIAVGTVNREESAKALEDAGYNDAVIALVGNRIMITGYSDEAVCRAVDLFIEKYLTEGELTVSPSLYVIERAEYKKADLTVGGVPISEYIIVYDPSYINAAKEVAHRIGKLTGAVIPLHNDTTDNAAYEITIGAGSRATSSKEHSLDDFTIAVNGSSINITAGNKTAVEMASAELCEMLATGDKNAYELSDLALDYTLPADRSYIDDIESLPMHWALEFDPPDWMLDYDEKYAATLDAGGRLMSCAHRGDRVYYPENSIEGIISAIMMGCDMIEIDPRLTKDGVLILMHDATLNRTTSFEQKAGKNGLPSSANVSDWTYEQLMQLNLKERSGGAGTDVTPYKIPTLEEVIKVCANRIFIRLDVKTESDSDEAFWDFEKDIWPLMEKYESYSNILYTWHVWFRENNYKLTDTYRAKALELSGKAGIVFINDVGTFSANNKIIQEHGFNPGIRFAFAESGTSYKTFLSNNKGKLKSYKGKLRTYSHVYNAGSESHDFYAELYEAGINYHIVNKALLICTYIAENFEPTPYTTPYN